MFAHTTGHKWPSWIGQACMKCLGCCKSNRYDAPETRRSNGRLHEKLHFHLCKPTERWAYWHRHAIYCFCRVCCRVRCFSDLEWTAFAQVEGEYSLPSRLHVVAVLSLLLDLLHAVFTSFLEGLGFHRLYSLPWSFFVCKLTSPSEALEHAPLRYQVGAQ
jgi:hypothetical protein